MNTILDYAGQFADTSVSIGGKIITFMTTPGHELALVGVISFILILAVTMISRFFKN